MQHYMISYLSSGQNMSCQLDFGEISFPNSFEEAIVANMRVLLCRSEGVATSWQAMATCRLGGRRWGVSKAIHRGMLR